MSIQSPPLRLALLGTYPPRKCGIATFTSDLAIALQSSDQDPDITVFAMSDRPGYSYGGSVRFEIAERDLADYERAKTLIERGRYHLLSIQHEFGLFGGRAGDYLLKLLDGLTLPIVTTLHTVLRNPTADQRRSMRFLSDRSDRFVVMSQKAIGIMESTYGIDPTRVDLIPHGVPRFASTRGDTLKKLMGIDGPMLLTFGLLSPDKGIQYALSAMPAILRVDPKAVYVVLGTTHPQITAVSGDAYRRELTHMVENLGLEASVRFVDEFVSTEELGDYLGASDIYVTPSLNPQQITSGTLAYAVAAGKPIISTEYLYATELLAEDRGMLVPFRNSEAIAQAAITLLAEPELRQAMARRTKQFSEAMGWSEVGRRYMQTFDHVISLRRGDVSSALQKADLPTETSTWPCRNLNHLMSMTDDTGLLQHAIHNTPDRAHGYCSDDNTRALLLSAYSETELNMDSDMFTLQGRALAFLLNAFDESSGRFRNFMLYNRSWVPEKSSDDCHGRCIWGLGSMVGRSASVGRRRLCMDLFERAAPAMEDIGSPRAWAYAALGAHEYLGGSPGLIAEELQIEMAHRLLDRYRACSREGWRWFEEIVSYANARLSQALILSGSDLGNEDMTNAGLESLRWLMEVQTTLEGRFSPIGSNGFYTSDGRRASFDQQPIEAWSSTSACISAAMVTGEQAWLSLANSSFKWFLGENDLGIQVYDPSTGGCRDGLHEDRPNENQGAESTLSFLCALSEMNQASPMKLTTPGANESTLTAVSLTPPSQNLSTLL